MLTLSDTTDIWIFRRNDQGKWTWQPLAPQGERPAKSQAGVPEVDNRTGEAGAPGYTPASGQTERRTF